MAGPNCGVRGRGTCPYTGCLPGTMDECWYVNGGDATTILIFNVNISVFIYVVVLTILLCGRRKNVHLYRLIGDSNTIHVNDVLIRTSTTGRDFLKAHTHAGVERLVALGA